MLIVVGYKEVYDVISALKKSTVKLTHRKHKDLCFHSYLSSFINFLAEMPAKPAHFLLALSVSTDYPQVTALNSSVLFFLSQAHSLSFLTHL